MRLVARLPLDNSFARDVPSSLRRTAGAGSALYATRLRALSASLPLRPRGQCAPDILRGTAMDVSALKVCPRAPVVCDWRHKIKKKGAPSGYLGSQEAILSELTAQAATDIVIPRVEACPGTKSDDTEAHGSGSDRIPEGCFDFQQLNYNNAKAVFQALSSNSGRICAGLCCRIRHPRAEVS